MRVLTLGLATLLGCLAPAPRAAKEVASGAQDPTPALLERYDLDRPVASFELPGRLDEISGLAFSPDGRLFAHDDERGRVYRVDPGTGAVGDRFDLGDEAVRADFEGIAIANDRFFLVTSRGLLYEFREAPDGEKTRYRVTDAGAGARCEFEGLDYDPELDALLLPCKVATPDDGTIVIHRLPLDPGRPRLDPIRVRKIDLAAHGLEPEFDPSGIALSPTGTLVLVSGRHEAIIELTRDGTLLAAARLPHQRHRQTEGIAFGPDGTLYLSDERHDGDARLTSYARRAAPGGADP